MRKLRRLSFRNVVSRSSFECLRMSGKRVIGGRSDLPSQASSHGQGQGLTHDAGMSFGRVPYMNS